MKTQITRPLISTLVTASLMLLTSQVFAANIGNWVGSNRSWNSSDMSTIKNAMVNAGHTVEADEAMTAINLANDQLFIIGEAGSTPVASDMNDLVSWVTGGGRLLLFTDSGFSGGAGGNSILTAFGSTMSFSTNSPVAGSFQSGNFATNNIYNIVGQNLVTSPGSAVSGGNVLSGDYLHYQQYGNGFIYAFADRSDHNVFSPDGSHVNGELLLNIAGPVPEPETYGMMLVGLGIMGFIVRRRKS